MTSSFEHPEAFRWLGLVLTLGLLTVWSLYGRRRVLSRFADHPTLIRLAPRLSILRPALRAVLTVIASASSWSPWPIPVGERGTWKPIEEAWTCTSSST